MNKLIVPSAIIAAGMVAAAALSQQATPPASGFQAKPYFQMPLEKDPSRLVRLQNVVIPTTNSATSILLASRPPEAPNTRLNFLQTGLTSTG